MLTVLVLWITVPTYLNMQMTLQLLDWSQIVMGRLTMKRLRMLHIGVKRIIFCGTMQKPKKKIINLLKKKKTTVTIRRSKIDVVEHFRYLGVVFDREVTWNHHMDIITCK